MESMLRGAPGYGALELRAYYQRFMIRSLVMSVSLHLAIISAFYGIGHTDETPVAPRIPAIIIPITKTPTAQIFRGGTTRSYRSSGVKGFFQSKFAIPVPAPIGQEDSSQLISMWPRGAGIEGDPFDFGDARNGVTGGEGLDPDDSEPPPFVPWEKEPQIVKRVEPRYPDLAIRTGIEGTVIVNIWVDKQGRVRKTKVVKSTAEIFNATAIEAACQWIFTPAVMQKGPVSVWVCLPFNFRLNAH